MGLLTDTPEGQAILRNMVTALNPGAGERQTVAGDPSNPTAANAAYMADPVMQEKTRQNQGGRS